MPDLLTRILFSIRTFFPVLVFLLFTVLYFHVSFTLPFFWDDGFIVQANPFLNDWGNIPRAFWDQKITTGFLDSLEGQIYRPLRTVYFIVTACFFGKNPAVFHAVNVFLHWAVSLLLFQILQSLVPGRKKSALFFTALFLFHPVHLESVNSVFGCADLWGSLLFAWIYREWLRLPLVSWRTVIAGALVLYGAMLFKEMFVTTPLLLTLLCWRKMGGNPLKACFLNGASLIYFFQRWFVVRHWDQSPMSLSFGEHAIRIFQTFFFYLKLFFCPLGLSQTYSMPRPELSAGLGLESAALGLFLGAGLWLWLRNRREPLFAFGIYSLSTLPIVGIVSIATFANDRLFYFPSLVLVVMLFQICISLSFKDSSNEDFIFLSFPRKRESRPPGFTKDPGFRVKPGMTAKEVFRDAINWKWTLYCAGMAALVWIYALGYQRNQEWKTPSKIWEKSYQQTGSHLALWNMMMTMMQEGRYPEIVEFFKNNPVELPVNEHPYYNRFLAVASGRAGLTEDFWNYYQALLKSDTGPYGEHFLSKNEWRDFVRDLQSLSSSTSQKILKDVESRHPEAFQPRLKNSSQA